MYIKQSYQWQNLLLCAHTHTHTHIHTHTHTHTHTPGIPTYAPLSTLHRWTSMRASMSDIYWNREHHARNLKRRTKHHSTSLFAWKETSLCIKTISSNTVRYYGKTVRRGSVSWSQFQILKYEYLIYVRVLVYMPWMYFTQNLCAHSNINSWLGVKDNQLSQPYSALGKTTALYIILQVRGNAHRSAF